MSDKEKLPEDLQKSLVDIFKLYEREDIEIRKAQIRQWKKNEEFWHGVQYLFWSQRDEAWRSPVDIDWQDEFQDEELEELGSFYDYVVNIFRGHGESIIAALAAEIPSLRFIPDDADDPDDILTARTYNKICDLIQRHNKAKLLALRSFFFLYINGIVASYIYKDSDFKYGSYTIPEYSSEVNTTSKYTCPDCGYDLSQENISEENEKEKVICPQCGEEIKPKKEDVEEEVPVISGTKKLPKTRIKIDLFGGLQVKVPWTARNQDECNYLIYYADIPKESAIEIYPDLEEEIEADHIENYDRFSRTEFTFPSDPEVEQKNLVTIFKCWMRPVAFNRERDKKKREKLKELFPTGVRLEVVGKQKKFGAAVEEGLDSRWRIGQAGLSTFIHSDAICTPLVSVQEMRNTLINLTMETIQHGIPSEFADPRVLNFDEYGRFEATPGYVYKTLPGRPGDKIADGFYTGPRAQLAKEVPVFQKFLDEDAQFVLGSFPSIYGGPSKKDRSTFREYQASREIALQRLQIVWQFFVDWFKETMENACHLFVETIVEDEKFPTSDKTGNYVNVWIRQSELEGKVGGCESDSDSSFPVSLAQKKAILLELMQMNNEFINAALYTPKNAQEIQDALALNELELPGAAQRIKQILEIKELCKSEPLSDGISSIPPEPDIDDDAVHIETCKAYLVDTTGIDLKRVNPVGYMNVYFHMKQHQANLMMQTAKPGPGPVPAGTPPPTTQVGPEQ